MAAAIFRLAESNFNFGETRSVCISGKPGAFVFLFVIGISVNQTEHPQMGLRRLI